MADDDGLSDLLEGMDDLEASLFGKSVPNKPAQPNMLTSILSNQSENPRRSNVTFAPEPSTRAAKKPVQKTSFDDLFGDSQPKAAEPVTREPRRPATSTISDLFGSRRSDPSPPKVEAQSEAAPPPPPLPQTAPSAMNLDTARIQRLEAEIDRLNRELDDIKRRKRDDEEDLERLWKDRLEKSEKDNASNMEAMKKKYQSQIEKMEEDSRIEVERLKTNYERQLEGLTSSISQTQDLIGVVQKVENISTTIGKIADGVTSNTDKFHSEHDIALRVREEKLLLREERLHQESIRFEEEREKVHELNARLNEMCKNHEKTSGHESFKLRESWNKLQAEKKVFLDDQNMILAQLAKERAFIETKTTKFHQEQHDLLVRVSTERQLLEQDKTEFHARRNMDINRLKKEAEELEEKIQQVLAAEQSIYETKTQYESKLRQLQDLEVTLMEECVEMERMRNTVRAAAMMNSKPGNLTRPSSASRDNNMDVEYSVRDTNRRNDSVRATLKKRSEYLDKYVGQKVAAVAPHNN